jgi:Co/Zn/Cd efflux system component
MSASCSDHCDDTVFQGMSPAYKRTLLAVIGLNLAGFAASGTAAMASGSTALAANAGDFLGDSLTYAVSLAVIGRSARLRASAALFKGATLGVAGVALLGFAGWRLLNGAAPDGGTISLFGAIGLVLNVVAALLLFRFREGDANVRSVWLCTRNDALENVGVIGAGGLVALTGAVWPDLAMGALLGVILLHSAWEIIDRARKELVSTSNNHQTATTH